MLRSMTNENEILRMIRERVGQVMTGSSDFDVLAQSIRDVTNENLGVNTLKSSGRGVNVFGGGEGVV